MSKSPKPAPPAGFDEMWEGDVPQDMFAVSKHRRPRAHYQPYYKWLGKTESAIIASKRHEADVIFRRSGITFAVYGEKSGEEDEYGAEHTSSERLIPADLVPRIVSAEDWEFLQKGLIQRVKALNMFLHDVYHKREILRADVIPPLLVLNNQQYLTYMVGIDLPHNIYANIAGIDIVRDHQGDFFVLEDNLRVPSGVSYMLSNRVMMMRLFPELFHQYEVCPVEHYPITLLQTLRSLSHVPDPTIVLLTPGCYNSAYFEHAFLAKQMGIELVEGQDLFVREGKVWMRTTSGPQRVDVIYRRIDDQFLDPLTLRPDSYLGVPGLLAAYRMGEVVIANAPGTGVADDKSVYPYVTEMIRFYLDEAPILKNVPTWQCNNPESLQYVLDNLPELVVKEVHGSGGYGMLVGPAASKDEIHKFRDLLKKHPTHYIAQPTLSLSTCPTFVDSGIAPRHVDLRPFVLSSADVQVIHGGLTRVALREGSLVVNSSQGGGTKDTWVLENIDNNQDTDEGATTVTISSSNQGVSERSGQAKESIMLSRVASELYWLSRHLERAENTSRILSVSQTLSMVADFQHNPEMALEPVYITNTQDAYKQLYPGIPTSQSITHFLAWNRHNPLSISSCIELSRENARSVRSSITSEMLESINETWLELQTYRQKFMVRPFRAAAPPSEPNPFAETDQRDFYEWIKQRSHLITGTTLATLRRSQAFLFLRLGALIERSDNTARILSVKHNRRIQVGRERLSNKMVAYYKLGALLKSVSGVEAYRDIYRDTFSIDKVADLLIFSDSLPRSLRFCLEEIVKLLDELPVNRGKEARKLTGLLFAKLKHGEWLDVQESGLEDYLHQFLDEHHCLASAIHAAYLELN